MSLFPCAVNRWFWLTKKAGLTLGVAALTLGLAAAAGAQTAAAATPEEKAVVEVGGVAEHGLNGGGGAGGVDLGVEWTPIPDKLELEAGTSLTFARGGGREWDSDFLFKKPWTLSPHAEFMLGAGPEFQHASAHGVSSNALAGEVAGDFMFWPGSGHRFGWFIEPSVDQSFTSGHERSASVSIGLLIAIR